MYMCSVCDTIVDFSLEIKWKSLYFWDQMVRLEFSALFTHNQKVWAYMELFFLHNPLSIAKTPAYQTLDCPSFYT